MTHSNLMFQVRAINRNTIQFNKVQNSHSTCFAYLANDRVEAAIKFSSR